MRGSCLWLFEVRAWPISKSPVPASNGDSEKFVVTFKDSKQRQLDSVSNTPTLMSRFPFQVWSLPIPSPPPICVAW